VPKKRSYQDLTVDELRWLLMEKRRSARQQRIERFRRSGRVVMLSSDAESPTSHTWRTGELLDEVDDPVQRSLARRLFDGGLLVVEVGAVAAFLFILYSFISMMQDLNREAVSLQALPSLTPTPLISAVVLPSGHTPPNSPGGAQFNDAEIPEHLRPLVQSLANVPLPTPSPGQARRIQIPAIRVDAPVVQGDGWEQLKKGVGQSLHSSVLTPGQPGNLIMSAHNDIFGEIFRDLDQLKPGDQVIVHSGQRAFTYIVTDTRLVEPTQVEVMAPVDQPVVTLISCYPYMKNTQRIVIRARLQEGGG
jgi:sortase A